MTLTPQIIIRTVCDYFHQEEADVLSTSQERKFIVPRQVAMYFIKEFTKKSLAETGKYFNGRCKCKDHATILHAIKAVNNQLDTDKKFKEAFNVIERKLLLKGRKSLKGSFSTSTVINFRFYFIKKIRRYTAKVVYISPVKEQIKYGEPIKFRYTKYNSPFANLMAQDGAYSGYKHY